MFVLNEKPLALDVPFGASDTLFPAAWLRLISPSEREAIDVTEISNTSISSAPDLFGVVFSNSVTSASLLTDNSLVTSAPLFTADSTLTF